MPTLVNICGTSRSGSTMLDVMLGGGPDAFSCGEVYAWFRPWRRHHFSIDCCCGQRPCTVWERIGQYTEGQFHACTCRELDLDFVVDSSKNEHWVFDSNRWAARNGMRVINILIWRRPQGLAYSQWRRGKPLDEWRARFLTYHDRILRLGLPMVCICYEELVRDPRGQLRRLCQQIGMSYRPGQERFWERDHHHLFGSPSVRRAIRLGLGQIQLPGLPDDFSREFETYQRRLASDLRLETCLGRLQAMTTSGPTVVPELTRLGSGQIALWRMRERLARRWRRRFPAPVPAD